MPQTFLHFNKSSNSFTFDKKSIILPKFTKESIYIQNIFSYLNIKQCTINSKKKGKKVKANTQVSVLIQNARDVCEWTHLIKRANYSISFRKTVLIAMKHLLLHPPRPPTYSKQLIYKKIIKPSHLHDGNEKERKVFVRTNKTSCCKRGEKIHKSCFGEINGIDYFLLLFCCINLFQCFCDHHMMMPCTSDYEE